MQISCQINSCRILIYPTLLQALIKCFTILQELSIGGSCRKIGLLVEKFCQGPFQVHQDFSIFWAMLPFLISLQLSTINQNYALQLFRQQQKVQTALKIIKYGQILTEILNFEVLKSYFPIVALVKFWSLLLKLYFSNQKHWNKTSKC